MEMYSLDFEEFLWAIGVKKETISYLNECFQKQQSVMDVIHEKMKTYFLWHILVGGMPAVVNEFVKSKNFHNVLKEQRVILQGYLNDISKYAKLSDKLKARECSLSIPQQLAKPNKKFQYSLLEEYGQKKKYESSLQWLYDAGIISYCYNVTEPRLPLMTHKISSKFKIYMKDTGLLIAMMEEGTQKAILNGNLNLNNGAVYENIISEVFLKNDKELFYFERKGKLEIDFLLNIDGELTAIEVKSGDNQKAKSLSILLSEKYRVPFGIKITKDNVEVIDQILKLPYYMTMFL